VFCQNHNGPIPTRFEGLQLRHGRGEIDAVADWAGALAHIGEALPADAVQSGRWAGFFAVTL